MIEDMATVLRGREPASMLTLAEQQALEHGGLDLAPPRDDEPDVLLETSAQVALIEAKALGVTDLASRLRVTAARIRQRAIERSLYAIRVDDEWRFPEWQVDTDGLIPGVAAIAGALPDDIHPVAVCRFMTTPNPDLDVMGEAVSPRDWLTSGGSPDPIVAIAQDL